MRKCKNSCTDKQDNGNCLYTGKDGLPVQCVGPWVKDKYFFLENYLNASCKARKMFSQKNNAVYIDLFSGPGKCIDRSSGLEIDTGAIKALTRDEGSFNEAHLFDKERDNINALKSRLSTLPVSSHFYCGDSNILIDNLTENLKKKSYRYHFSYIDPFGAEALSFKTLQKLAMFERMDMLIHFPIGAIKRNYDKWVNSTEETILDRFLGTRYWRNLTKNCTFDKTYQILVELFVKQMQSIGYPEKGLKYEQKIYNDISSVSIKNTKNVTMYLLVLAAKHPLAQKLWASVSKGNRHKQMRLF